MGLLSLIYLVCAFRTNLVFVAIFLGLFMTFVLLASSYWHHAIGHHDLGGKLQVVSTGNLDSFIDSQRLIHAGIWCLRLHGCYSWMVSFLHLELHEGYRVDHVPRRWIFFAQMLASVDFPFQLPVGDISHVIKGGSTRLAEREQFSA